MVGKKKKNKKDEDIEEEINNEDAQRHLDLVQEVLENTQANIKKALKLIKSKDIDTESLLGSLKEAKEVSAGFVTTDTGNERIIEGVFNGDKMVGGDGVEYNIPANYASKSKLVEGDILKLTITKNGSFIYKQIGPVERRQVVKTLVENEQAGEWYAVDDNQKWKLLTASVTYFHGEGGDEVVILVPKEGESQWAAVENIIKTNNH